MSSATSASASHSKPAASSLNARGWQRARRPIHDALYEDLVGTVDCGAFDGGCLIFAQALQKVIGGEIYVVTRPDGGADHAAVLHQGRLWDYDGPLRPAAFIRRFNRTERAHTVAIRPIAPGDLANAARDAQLAVRLARLLATCLSA